MTTASAKSERINLRIQPERLVLLERAAAVRNLSLSEFMLTTAAEAAENALLDQRIFEVDEKAFKNLEKALAAPTRKNAKLEDLFSRKSPWN